ncbi:MAG: YciI family protein [Rhodobacterales bacterium]|nr:YciI family protein [Rhodobacterales bacterium]
MQYMILIYSDLNAEPAYGTDEGRKMMEGYFTLNQELKAAGAWVAGDALQRTSTATTLRIRDGKTETMDGPFAETKEALGGYYLIEAPDLDAALGWAAKVPAAHYGSVEVRPIVVFS